jgi:hypothetical protein
MIMIFPTIDDMLVSSPLVIESLGVVLAVFSMS